MRDKCSRWQLFGLGREPKGEKGVRGRDGYHTGEARRVEGNLRAAHPSQDVQAEHPPDKKQRDDTEHNVRHPLPCGFWLSEVKHGAIVTFCLAAAGQSVGKVRTLVFAGELASIRVILVHRSPILM
jgi:hypothetical protein